MDVVLTCAVITKTWIVTETDNKVFVWNRETFEQERADFCISAFSWISAVEIGDRVLYLSHIDLIKRNLVLYEICPGKSQTKILQVKAVGEMELIKNDDIPSQ